MELIQHPGNIQLLQNRNCDHNFALKLGNSWQFGDFVDFVYNNHKVVDIATIVNNFHSIRQVYNIDVLFFYVYKKGLEMTVFYSKF